MIDYTESQLRTFLKRGGEACPVCLGKDIDRDPIQEDGEEMWRNCECNECGERWMSCYDLTTAIRGHRS